MTSVLKEIIGFYKYVAHDLADSKTHKLPLVSSPITVLGILIGYFVCVFKLWPAYMKNREPYNLRKVLITYNAFQMVYCITLVIKFWECVPITSWTCSPIGVNIPMDEMQILGGYCYFILKIIDLLDTFFFILKKNYRQVTFLHVYHHSLMVFVIWFGLRYFPGGHSAFLPYINTIVHVVMYGYYLLSAYDDKYKKSIWWKKHITQLQLFQFGLLTVLYTTPIIYDCGYPKVLCLFILLINATMMGLFGNFYYKTYIKKNKKYLT